MCGGDPLCVKYCVPKALKLVEKQEVAASDAYMGKLLYVDLSSGKSSEIP
jgi:hypothetical protein